MSDEKLDTVRKNPPKRDDKEDEVEGEEENEDEQKKAEEKRVRKEAVQRRKEEVRRKAEERRKREKALKEEEEEDEEDIPPAAPKSTKKAPPVSIREDIVNTCVNFLNHPKVKPSPLSQKMAFLQKKGLTQEEIQEALNRANAVPSNQPTFQIPSSPMIGSNPVPQQYGPPVVYAPPPPPPPPAWYEGRVGLFVTAVSCIGAGIGFTLLAKKYLLREGDSEKNKEIEQSQESTQKLATEVSSTLKEMQIQNSELRDFFKNFLQQQQQQTHSPQNGVKASPSSVEQQQKIEIAELKSEIKKLKAIMLDNRSSQSVPSPSSVSSWSPSESKIPLWMQKESGKNPLSFDDSYKILEKAQSRGTAGEGSATSSLEEEPRPKDFGRILQMVNNGQIPDDVKPINDKPLDPHTKIERGQRQAPLKPWQKATSILSETSITDSGSQVVEITDDQDGKKETNGHTSDQADGAKKSEEVTV